MVHRTVEGAGVFEERRRGERYKLAVPVQLNDGIGTTCDISTSGIFFETVSAYNRRHVPTFIKFRTRDPPVRGARDAGGAAQWSIRHRRGADVVCFLLRDTG